MFGQNRGTKTRVAEAASTVQEAAANVAGTVVNYIDPLARDEKLRRRLVAAIVAGAAARNRIRRHTGLAGRLAADPVLRAQLVEMTAALQAAQKRAKKGRSHRIRNTILFLTSIGMTIAALPAVRAKAAWMMRGHGWLNVPGATPTTIEEEIELSVPVSTAYNQWTQFEEFPQFMEGVDEVRQLDDTLLHWAATVAGKRAEWDAKIIEQEPDRRITWESTDGKATRGTVSFEEVGPIRSRLHLQMSYTPEGVTEKVGSVIGLDSRRIRGDLRRFRDLIENRQAASGAWRGEVRGGVETSTESSRQD